MTSAILLSAFALMGAAATTAPAPCSISTLEENPEGYFWPERFIRQFVTEADLVVRAVAEQRAPTQPRGVGVPQDTMGIRFRFVEVIRGTTTDTSVVLGGTFVANDDFNTGSVPYRIVRRAGQRGNCYAGEYRQGAEYLLLLRRHRIGWTANWVPLAPTNEQLRGADDPWLAWVKNVARAAARSAH